MQYIWKLDENELLKINEHLFMEKQVEGASTQNHLKLFKVIIWTNTLEVSFKNKK